MALITSVYATTPSKYGLSSITMALITSGYATTPSKYGLSSTTMALITSGCGPNRSSPPTSRPSSLAGYPPFSSRSERPFGRHVALVYDG